MSENNSAELTALLTGAGVYALKQKRFARASGRDRVRWLNNLTTNAVAQLAEDSGCYAFVLNAQGRIQGDLDIWRRAADPEHLWIETDATQLEPLTTYLRRYIIMDQVLLEPAPDRAALGLAGPGAAELLAALHLPASALTPGHLAETSLQQIPLVLVSIDSPLIPRYELWTAPENLATLQTALVSTGAVPCRAESVAALRILEGRPVYGIDITDRDLPQETDQLRALSFNKGCYLGQEIVERIRSRGSVHRTLSGFLIEDGDPAPKTPILSGEKQVGELTSVARIGERAFSLGIVRKESLNTPLTAQGHSLIPSPLPFQTPHLSSRAERSAVEGSAFS